jgi:ABC-type phosphate transport system substrate-binding protein
MSRNRYSILPLAAAIVLCVFLPLGCTTRGEETVREKDFATSPTIKTAIGAAGSTFIAPIMTNWINAYQRIQPSTLINYRPIGSGAGLIELRKNLLGLAASDAPLSDEQLKQMFPVIQGLTEFVKKNVGTIGYAELHFARQNDLPVASIQNRSGSFVTPSSASTTAAIEAFSEVLSKDVRSPIVDAPASAKEAYPLAGLTFLVVPKDSSDPDTRKTIRDFIRYAVTTGQDSAESLDYAKLPKALQEQDQNLLSGLLVAQSQ